MTWQVVGVDGYSKGWVAVALGQPGGVGLSVHGNFADLEQTYPDAAVIGVDIPIGMPQRGVREAEVAARAFIGKRSSSVFMTPPEAVLRAATYAEARPLAVNVWGRGVSAQAYALRHRILEVAAAAAADDRIHEVHPEVCFAALNGEPLEQYKKTWDGQMARRALLRSAGIELSDHLGGDLGKVPPDDVLDAAVAAWTARRIASGEAQSLPSPPESVDGRRVAIWY